MITPITAAARLGRPAGARPPCLAAAGRAGGRVRVGLGRSGRRGRRGTGPARRVQRGAGGAASGGASGSAAASASATPVPTVSGGPVARGRGRLRGLAVGRADREPAGVLRPGEGGAVRERGAGHPGQGPVGDRDAAAKPTAASPRWSARCAGPPGRQRPGTVCPALATIPPQIVLISATGQKLMPAAPGHRLRPHPVARCCWRSARCTGSTVSVRLISPALRRDGLARGLGPDGDRDVAAPAADRAARPQG